MSIPASALSDEECLHYAALELAAAAELTRRLIAQCIDPSAEAESLREDIRKLESRADDADEELDQLRDGAEETCRYIKRAINHGGYVLMYITLRILQPQDLKAAQGFDKDYIIDRGLFIDPVTGAEQWLPINKTNQVRLIGSSVCPDEAEALVRANAADILELYRRLAA